VAARLTAACAEIDALYRELLSRKPFRDELKKKGD
jgi:hypothetical protein